MYIRPRLGNVEFESWAEVVDNMLDSDSSSAAGRTEVDFILLMDLEGTWVSKYRQLCSRFQTSSSIEYFGDDFCDDIV